MRKFLVYISVFFAIIIVIDILFGIACRYLNSHAKGGDTASHYDITMKQTEPVLIMGSSRAIHHYDCKIMEDSLGVGVYNCGVDGNGILFQYGRLSLLLERYTPRMIIYDAMPRFDISGVDDVTRNLAWLRRWYGLSETLDTLFRDISDSERFKLLSNLYRYNGDFMQLLSDNIKPMQEVAYKGYKPLYGEIDYTPEKECEHIEEWNPLKLKYFKKLIALCKQKNISLVVVYSPWLGKENSLSLTRLTELCDENDIPIIDYYGVEEFNNNPMLFQDASHLNDEGAKAYTKSVVGRIRRLSY
ncbi:MAG: hypothetical protein IKL83_05825 [Muribaculaceae bacterium]|nr:hypothetical protein [Muribaculaceae bacterium]